MRAIQTRLGRTHQMSSVDQPLQQATITSNYIPHIDGLRAIAVMAIVLFHFDVHFFSGGFIGVDIFFVISGYLITAHIQQDLQKGTFRLVNFYGRRLRRLLPALVFTLFTCLITGYLLFPADRFAQLALNSLQALFSIANISYWLEAGYFDSSASMKPLLHTWSLSVEEQFYLLWPGLLLLLGLNKHRWLIILVIGVVSLMFSEYWLNKDPGAAFFLMPFRVVEFCLGALMYRMGTASGRSLTTEGLTALGLMLILLPIFFYNEALRFPGVSALIPCLGTAILIYAAGESRLGILLRNRVAIGLGLISYSLYLVHWPLVVFYKYANSPQLRTKDQLLLISAALLLAFAMYRLVETPFRHRAGKAGIATAYFASIMLASVLGLTFIAGHIYTTQGWPWRLSHEQLTPKQIEKGKSRRYSLPGKTCPQKTDKDCNVPLPERHKNVLILGDSHSPDALNIFYQAYPEYRYVRRSLPGGCPPIAEQDLGLLGAGHPDREQCIALNTSLFDKELLQDYDTIVISVFFQWYRPEHLLNTVTRLQQLSDARILVLGNYISLNRDMADLHNQRIDPRTRPEFIESFARFEEELRQQAMGRYVFISKKSLFCDGDEIDTCRIYFDQAPFVYDQHHLSFEASRYAAQQLKKRFPSLENVRNSADK